MVAISAEQCWDRDVTPIVTGAVKLADKETEAEGILLPEGYSKRNLAGSWLLAAALDPALAMQPFEE